MKKTIKLTVKERRAVKSSIKHWERDIIKLFLLGDSIEKGLSYDLYWKCADTDVKCHEYECSLCKIADPRIGCDGCPYTKKYGYACDGYKGHWRKFFTKPTLRRAKEMVKALENILK